MRRTDFETKRFWLLILTLVLSICVLVADEWLGDSRDIHPLLEGPPQFIVLSLILAISAYLRQLSTSADAFWDQIREGEVFLYPLGEQHTVKKMHALEITCKRLAIVAPFMITLSIVVAARIVFDSILRFPNPPFEGVASLFPLVDFIIAVWMFSLFGALTVMHAKASERNENIRVEAKAYVDREHPLPDHAGETTRQQSQEN